MSGLRKVEIVKPSEFGLDVKLSVNYINIYVEGNEQRIDVSYFKIFSFKGVEVKREKLSFTLKDNKDVTPAVIENGVEITPEIVVLGRQYLSEWDQLVGDVISGGIISYLS